MRLFAKTELPNGTRVISERITSVRSVSIGIWVEVGSRDESPQMNGISHFVEHMHFKRTKTRSAFQIAQSLEALGGSINAFTAREHTCYYARVLDQHLPQAMNVLGDILNNSLFTPADLKKEKSVVIEEIKDVADTPSDYIHDLFDAQMWKTNSLGQPIMGTDKNIRALTRKDIIRFLREYYYQGPHIVVSAAGDLSHDALVRLTRKYLRWPDGGVQHQTPVQQHNGFTCRAYKRRTKQTQVCLGFPSISFADPDRYTILAANAYLSGGMSSRLFQTVREKAGYCYTIYSFQEFFRDTGVFCVYFGADGKQVVKAANLVLKELRRLKEKKLTAIELHEVKEQLKGSLMLSQESMYNRMNRIARLELMLGKYIDLDHTVRLIDRISATQIRDLANQILDRDCLTMCTLGPTRQAELEKINWSVL